MPGILIVAPMTCREVLSLGVQMSAIWMDQSYFVDWFEAEEAPFGVNLNRYDGIVVGCSDQLKASDKEWILVNREVVKRKKNGFFATLNHSRYFDKNGLISKEVSRIPNRLEWNPEISKVFCVHYDGAGVLENKKLIQEAQDFAIHFKKLIEQPSVTDSWELSPLGIPFSI